MYNFSNAEYMPDTKTTNMFSFIASKVHIYFTIPTSGKGANKNILDSRAIAI